MELEYGMRELVSESVKEERTVGAVSGRSRCLSKDELLLNLTQSDRYYQLSAGYTAKKVSYKV